MGLFMQLDVFSDEGSAPTCEPLQYSSGWLSLNSWLEPSRRQFKIFYSLSQKLTVRFGVAKKVWLLDRVSGLIELAPKLLNDKKGLF
jgi:hypothetical protein